jgi:hypothetical protein
MAGPAWFCAVVETNPRLLYTGSAQGPVIEDWPLRNWWIANPRSARRDDSVDVSGGSAASDNVK